MPKSRYLTIGLLAAAAIAVAAYLLLFAPANFRGTEYEFAIIQGDSIASVIDRLAENKFLRSRLGGQIAFRLSGVGILRPGNYNISPRLSAWQIASVIKESSTNDRRITIPEGYTAAQIADTLTERGVVNQSEFVVATKRYTDPSLAILAERPATYTSLEGYLFPDTYNFIQGSPASVVVSMMVGNLERRLESLDTYRTNTTHSVHELLTIASLVEREARIEADRKLIAGVILNRLAIGMRLDIDATVRYITNNWTKPLTVTELNINSPYNTRKVAGLPPGPICNPGLAAIAAVLSPTESDYLYYLTDRDGVTHYAKTLDEHNANKARYLN